MTTADVARHLAGRDLRLAPAWPVGADGRCTCPDPGCTSAGKTRAGGPGKPPPPRTGGRTTRTTRFSIDREASRIVSVEDDGQLAEMAEAAGLLPLPPTLMLESPAGNLRMVYRLPPGVPAGNYVNPDGWKVDILAKGRMPGPGTRRADGVYAMVLDVPVADAPAALAAWLAARYAERETRHRPALEGTERGARPGTGADPDRARPGRRLKCGAHGGPDRSEMVYAITMECFDTGMDEGGAIWRLEGVGAAAEKYGDRPGGVAA